jgi:hypothetical protein
MQSDTAPTLAPLAAATASKMPAVLLEVSHMNKAVLRRQELEPPCVTHLIPGGGHQLASRGPAQLGHTICGWLRHSHTQL